MNLSTLAYNFLTGQWKVDRLRTKEYLSQAERSMKLYAGAQPGINRPTPAVLSTPEDFRQSYERIVLIRGARQMEEDFQFFDGILNDFETYVIGDLKFLPDTGNRDADKAITAYLELQFDQADYAQTRDFTGLAQLAIRSMKRDGDCGFIVVDQGDFLKLSAVSGDRIGNPLVGANIGPDNYNGIIVDETSGAPTAFEIYRRLPKLNSYVFQQKVKANQFLHYLDPFRFEQYHGVTVFKNSIEHAFDIKQILDFTKLNIKWRSAQLPYVTNEQGRPRGSGYETLPNSPSGVPQPLQVQTDGVTQSFLKLGEGVMEYPNDFPNMQFTGIMEELRRDCAVGCKLPLEFCYRSDSGGVVQRFYVNKAERTFARDKRLIKRSILNPFKNRVIQKGIDTGFLDLSSFGNLSSDLSRFRGAWQMGSQISVDYGNEVDADIKQIDAGLMSPQDYASDNGKNLDAVMRDIETHTLNVFAAAKRISQATGEDISLVLPFLVKKFPNPGAGLKAAGDKVPATPQTV